ncbi:MAG: ATP-dependent DNA helicase RecG [Lachnospiraceae bacterium]|nr:ATP-dependent DNA helicase RecG [Lachnospiraceae bacterium]
MHWDSSLLEVKGIGEKTLKLLHKLELYKVKDLLYHLPRNYTEFPPAVYLEGIPSSGMTAVRARILSQPMETVKKGRFVILRFYLTCDTHRLEVVFFNMPYLKKALKPGQEYVFYGKVETYGGRRTLTQPKLYSPEAYEKLQDTLQPVYPLTKGLTGNTLQKAVKEILKQVSIPEILPEYVLAKMHFMERKEAFLLLHFPSRREEMMEARRRLAFEEFLIFCLNVKIRKTEEGKLPFTPALLPVADTGRLLERLPYTLTEAQKKVWKQLEEDLQKEVAMNRLIQGDVGSGKTILAILALLMTAANGRQGAMMAPTEVLAGQHFETISTLSRQYGLPIRPILLTGSLSAKAKKEACQKIREGSVNTVVGTQALIQEAVTYGDLALVITDEQHRFGVRQRRILQEKGRNTHVLVMSATPIPRTLAIILFGDLHISVLDELPAGRSPIKNCVVDPSYRNTAYRFMEKEVAAGHQAYVICPAVEEGEVSDMENVTDYTDRLRQCLPPHIRIERLHGKMKSSRKAQIMEDFAAGNTDILVSTTVIEVGINVPNATVMMVENAERVGLAQLHQLRGRVGRGEAQGYCIFINSSETAGASERLKLLEQSNDGFYLANEDLKLRGPGDIFGIRQSGEMEFAVGDIYNDAELLLKASETAEEMLGREEELQGFWNQIFSEQQGNPVDFRSI